MQDKISFTAQDFGQILPNEATICGRKIQIKQALGLVDAAGFTDDVAATVFDSERGRPRAVRHRLPL